MIEVVGAFAAVFLLQNLFEEIRARRANARELELLRIIRSLENKLTAKDIAGYIALQEQDVKQVPVPVPIEMPSMNGRADDEERARYYAGGVIYDDEK